LAGSQLHWVEDAEESEERGFGRSRHWPRRVDESIQDLLWLCGPPSDFAAADGRRHGDDLPKLIVKNASKKLCNFFKPLRLETHERR
jgi:hypothetical protein